MWNKFVGLFAALLLVAACETTPDQSSDTSGGGDTTASSTGGGEMTQEAVPEPMPAEPMGPTPGTQDDLVVNVGDRVFFDLDKAVLNASAQRTLERQAAWLSQWPSATIMIEGHCDERGTREYNLALGERRANAVREYLITQGIAPSRLRTISYGKERPYALGHNEEAWALNRRSVSVID
jgi:peptidoglycan-associated lipoprotein